MYTDSRWLFWICMAFFRLGDCLSAFEGYEVSPTNRPCSGITSQNPSTTSVLSVNGTLLTTTTSDSYSDDDRSTPCATATLTTSITLTSTLHVTVNANTSTSSILVQSIKGSNTTTTTVTKTPAAETPSYTNCSSGHILSTVALSSLRQISTSTVYRSVSSSKAPTSLRTAPTSVAPAVSLARGAASLFQTLSCLTIAGLTVSSIYMGRIFLN